MGWAHPWSCVGGKPTKQASIGPKQNQLPTQAQFTVCEPFPPVVGALGLLSGITCPSFMPTFTPTSGNLDVLATAALSQLPMGQPNGSVAPIPSTGVGAVGVTSIPGFTAIPAKLIRRIWALEYVEMWELLPETWRQDAAQVECCHAKRPKRGLITDIALWSECFAALAAALATRYPQKAPQFLAYLRTIVRASRNFEGTAWASYDAAYRRQAANSRSLDWATSDPALYNEAFTGRAKAIPRCQFCLSDTHQSRDCMFAPEDQKRYGQPSAPWRGASSVPVAQICRLFNRPGGSQCRFKLCRYAHLCARCNRPHPMSECDRRQAARPPRSPSPSAKARGA